MKYYILLFFCLPIFSSEYEELRERVLTPSEREAFAARLPRITLANFEKESHSLHRLRELIHKNFNCIVSTIKLLEIGNNLANDALDRYDESKFFELKQELLKQYRLLNGLDALNENLTIIFGKMCENLEKFENEEQD